MRILQINTSVNYGSTGRIAENIGSLLIKNGNESYIAYGRINGGSNSIIVKIGNKKDVIYHGLVTLTTDKHGFGSRQATKDFIKKIKKINPDLIALHNIHGYYINIEVLFNFLKESKIPVLWTLFDCWAFTGHCTYFDDINCEKWRTLCHNCPKSRVYPRSLVDNSKFNYRKKKELFNSLNNLQIITHSQWLANQVKKSFLSNYKINVTPSAINLDYFKPIDSNLKEKYSLIDKKVILGCASVWSERKGLQDFVKLNCLIGNDYKIVLIGLSHKQIKSLPIDILGISRTENEEELAMWYSLALVFVNPTTQDNFPTTNIESIACGTPVITYDTGGSPESIDQDTGVVVQKGDVKGVFQAINYLEAKNQNELKTNCVTRANRLYNKKYRYLDYIRIIESMV